MATDKHAGGRSEGDYLPKSNLAGITPGSTKNLGRSPWLCPSSFVLPVSLLAGINLCAFGVSDIIKQIKEIQERGLVNGPSKRSTHPRLSQFLLASNHGYIEKQAVAVGNLKERLDELESEDDPRADLQGGRATPGRARWTIGVWAVISGS